MPFLAALLLLAFPPTSYPYAHLLSSALALGAAMINVWACHRLARPDPAAPVDLPDAVRRGVALASLLAAAAFAFLMLIGRLFEVLHAAARTADPILDPAPLNPVAPEA